MTLVQLKDISHSFGGRAVLENISWQITDGRKIGLIGANGSGKTTLFRVVAGELVAEEGEVQRKRGLRIGFLRQEAQLEGEIPLFREMTQVFSHLLKIEREIEELEESMAHAEGETLTRILKRYSDLQERYREEGGYTYHHRIKVLLFGLRFKKEDLGTKVSLLSGGQKNMAALAHVLLANPDLLLLDEPTNYLDLEATQWLEQFLKEYAGTMIIVSHDRYLLDSVIEETVFIEDGRLRWYAGNYTDFVNQRKKERELQEKQYRLQVQYIRRTEDFIRRNIVGQKTKQAQSRRKTLAKLQPLERPRSPKSLKLHFESDRREGRVVLLVEGMAKRFGQRVLFENLSFSLRRGDRMAIVGPNGSGKTTLLRMLLGKVKPSAGEVRWGNEVEIGYYDQEHGDLGMRNRIIDEIWQVSPHLQEEELRDYLAKFLFIGDDVIRSIKSLSGGEQSRVVLAKLMLAGSNLLILDEPTNHLDIPSRAALEEALSNYSGTLLIVSHDRYFLDRVVNRIYHLENGEGKEYLGNYSAFRERREKETARQTPTKKKRVRKKAGRSTRQLEKVEGEIAVLEDKLQEVETLLANRKVASDWEMLQQLLQQKSDLSAEMEERFREWEQAIGQLET